MFTPSMDPNVLKTELLTDPNQRGYGQYIVSGQSEDANSLAGILNAIPTSGAPVVKELFLARAALFGAISPDMLSLMPTLSGSVQAKWDRILRFFEASDTISIDPGTAIGVRNIQTLRSAVADGALLSGTVAGLGRRNGTLCEGLYFAGASVSPGDVSFALRGAK